MNKKLAQHVEKVAFKASLDIGNLIPLLKEHCSETECHKIGHPIARVMGSISAEILSAIRDRPEWRSFARRW